MSLLCKRPLSCTHYNSIFTHLKLNYSCNKYLSYQYSRRYLYKEFKSKKAVKILKTSHLLYRIPERSLTSLASKKVQNIYSCSLRVSYYCPNSLSHTSELNGSSLPDILRRYAHTSGSNEKDEVDDDKPSSQVEETVHHLKEKSQDKTSSSATDLQKKPIERKSLGTRIKEEILHYYHGFRLLFLDVKLCSRYVWSILRGYGLSRREHRQLVRTTSDLFRLVPFSVFIIIPFMEFLLPVALKLFPGMLPSTFETTNEKEAKMKKTLKMKLEMAKFLQQTLDTMSVQGKGHRSARAKEFVEFFYEIQKTGKNVSNRDILKFSKLFEDELTLDSLTRPQLVALCRLLEMQPLGTNNFLRFQLRMKLRSLTADDKIIRNESVDSLAVWELQHACRARGMRAYGLSKDKLKDQLQQWLDLSLNEKVPPSLLLLSRTLFLPDKLATEETLAATISTLPEEAATRAKAKIGKREGKIDNQTRFEIIKAEEEKILEDKKEKEMELQEKKRKEESIKKKAQEEISKGKDVDVAGVNAEAVSQQILSTKIDDVLVDSAPILQDSATDIEKVADMKAAEDHLTAEDIDHVEEALEMIEIEKKRAFIEEKELLELKSEMKDYEQDVDDFKTAIKELNMDSRLKESKAAQRLFASVNGMIKRMEPVVSAFGQQKETLKLRLGQKTEEESHTEAAEVIKLDDLAKHMNRIVSATDSHKVEKILSVLSKMDDDLDGALKADHVMRVLRLLSEDSESMSTKLFEEVVEMMIKEDQLCAQKLAEKALSLPSISLKIPNQTFEEVPSNPVSEVSPPLDEVEKIVGIKELSKKPEALEEKR